MNQPVPYFVLAWKRLLLHLLLFELTFSPVCFAGELRFCYNGPQRILYKDCPGGFVAKEVVKATCMYYYKAEAVPNMESYLSDNICDQENNMRQLDSDYQDFSTTEFQLIEFDPDIAGGPTDGSDPAIEKCNETCLADWLEPKYWSPTKIFKDKGDLNDTTSEEYRKDYVELTKVILLKLINEDEFDDEIVESADATSTSIGSPGRLDFLLENSTLLLTPLTSLMKVLAKSMRITHKRCSPFIERSFYTLVFRTMIEFRRMNDNFPDLNVLPLKRIMKVLDKCEAEQAPYFIINGTRCEDKIVVQTITDLKSNSTMPHKLEPISFRWGRYDPIIEAAWSAVTFVHAFCFEYFVEDMLHYSLYVKSMNEIFVQPLVEKHWMYPFPVGKGMTLWEMAYDTPDIQNQMNNIDACVQAGYSGSVFENRLDRPFNKQELVETPEYEEDKDVPTPGWNKPVEEYWKMYERRGFQEMVEVLGYCAQGPDEIKTRSDDVADKMCFHDNP